MTTYTIHPKLPQPKFLVVMADKDHNYRLERGDEQRIVGGVTNAIGMIGGSKTLALKWWASGIATASFWRQLSGTRLRTLLQTAINTGKTELYEQHLRDAAHLAYCAHMPELERTSVYGVQAHDLYEKYVKGEPINLDAPHLLNGVKDSFMRFTQWWDQFKQEWEPIATELAVGSWNYGYGGTMDLLVRHRKSGSIAVVDYKNSGGMAVGHAAQVGGAYPQALAEQYDMVSARAFVVRVPKPEDGGGEVEVWEVYEDNSPQDLFALFLDCMSMRDKVASIEANMPKRRGKKKKAWEA